jgi:nucleotide-binding universal stress UspA family protein
MFKHILVPIDGSEQANRALDSSIALAQMCSSDVKITVLHVNPLLILNEPLIVDNSLYEHMEEEGRHIVSPAVEKLKAAQIEFSAEIKTGDPASVIYHLADFNHNDLIVMGSRGVGLMSEILLGSVSHKVIQHAHCPVMIIK